jgi:hypothetical protein
LIPGILNGHCSLECLTPGIKCEKRVPYLISTVTWNPKDPRLFGPRHLKNSDLAY